MFKTLSGLAIEAEPTFEALAPAVPIKRSVTDDYIICLEDGKKLKTLKWHLMTSYGMTPEAYRAKWSLKEHYPIVAPNYSAKRRELGKKIGLGRKAVLPEQAPEPIQEPVKRRTRKPAAA